MNILRDLKAAVRCGWQLGEEEVVRQATELAVQHSIMCTVSV
jgi:hypothetical protein